MTRTWSFYDPATGEFIGRTFTGPDTALAINTPRGLVALEGAHDHRIMRVNLDTGALEQWRDPPPPGRHEWDGAAWKPTRLEERRTALARIAALEASQARPLREMALALAAGSDDPDAATRVAAIDAEIAALRAVLNKNN